MKTTLTVIAAIIMPGGMIILALGIGTYLLARRRRARDEQPAEAIAVAA